MKGERGVRDQWSLLAAASPLNQESWGWRNDVVNSKTQVVLRRGVSSRPPLLLGERGWAFRPLEAPSFIARMLGGIKASKPGQSRCRDKSALGAK